MLRNTFRAVAQQDDTIDEKKLIGEVMRVHSVGFRTAKGYIDECVMMNLCKRDQGLLWHADEKEIRLKYLEYEKDVKKYAA